MGPTALAAQGFRPAPGSSLFISSLLELQRKTALGSVLIWILVLICGCPAAMASDATQSLHLLSIDDSKGTTSKEITKSSGMDGLSVTGRESVLQFSKHEYSLHAADYIGLLLFRNHVSDDLLYPCIFRKHRLSFILESRRRRVGKCYRFREFSPHNANFYHLFSQDSRGFPEVRVSHRCTKVHTLGKWHWNRIRRYIFNSQPRSVVSLHDAELALHHIELESVYQSQEYSENDSPDSENRVRRFVRWVLLLVRAWLWFICLFFGARLFVRHCSSPVRSLALIALMAVSAAQLLISIKY